MEVDKVKNCIVATLKWTLFPSDATPPPVCSTSELAQLIRFLLSRLGPEVAVMCSTHILENSLKDLLKQAITNLQASFQKLRSIHEHSTGPSPWVAMSRLVSTSHHITPILHQFSSGLCDLISTLLQVAVTPSSHCDLTALLNTFQTSWNEHILRILSQTVSVLKLDPDLQWSHCLATVCVCLVASELCHVLRSKCGAEKCANFLYLGQLPKILNMLDDIFPAALYSKYREWEEQEMGGACEPVRLAEGGGVVFRSVDALVALLSSVATVAKGCGHQRLTKSIKECSLRLVNSSWQHIQQVSQQEHPVHIRYVSLSSLLHLHTLLKTLSSQEGWGADLLRILEGQASAAKERLIHYHTQLCITCILQESDGGGGDWQNCRPFLEGERCSYTVQMWAYHMRGLLHDLYTYLPLKCFLLREEIMMGVLGVCLSHLASRYSQICPSSQRAELVLADVLVILTCTKAVLHTLGRQDHLPPVLSSVDICCDTLLLVGAVVTASLQQLEKALSGSLDSSAAVAYGWVEHVLEWQGRVCGGEGCEGRVPYPHLILPLHSSQYGCLLQALLSDDGAVSLGLCSEEEVWQGEGVVPHLLEVLVWCPHSVWALSSVCSKLPCRESEDGALSDVKLLQVPVVRKFLEQHLGPALHSHLLAKATSYHSNSKDLDLNAWCRGLLDGLQERLHTHLPRPLQALLYWMSGGNKESSTKRLAKILIAAINGCGLSCDPSHPCHAFILPTQRALCFALDPTCLHTSLPSHLQDIIELRSDYHKSLLKSLLHPSLLFPTPSNPSTLDADPSTLAREELSDCTLTEHTIAAEIITAQEKGLQALEAVHLALRKKLTGGSSDNLAEVPKYGVQAFNPMKEYSNMAALGTHQHMMQHELMMAPNHVDVIGVIRGADQDMALKLIKTARWEWQAKEAAELTPVEQQLVQRINSLRMS